MPRPIRLNSAEQREWKTNYPRLVTKEGVPATLVSPSLEEQCSKVIAQARQKRKGVRHKAKIVELDELGIKHTRELTIEARVKKSGTGIDDFQVYCFVEGMLKVSTRDIMMARFLKLHGECMLQKPNGKFLKRVRDPKLALTAAKRIGPSDGIRHAPHPENCPCKQWGGRAPGKHHPICEFNLMAPPEERGTAPGEDSAGHPIRRLPPGVTEAKVMPPPEPPKIPSPEECHCKAWDRSDPEAHHNICEHKDSWEARNKPTYYLVDIDTQKVVREADAKEIGEAEIAKKKTGIGQIEKSGALYAVLTKEELPQKESAVEEEIGEEGEGQQEPAVPSPKSPFAELDVAISNVPSEDHSVPSPEDALDFDMGEGAPSAGEEPEDKPPPARGAGIDTSIDEGGLNLLGIE